MSVGHPVSSRALFIGCRILRTDFSQLPERNCGYSTAAGTTRSTRTL